MCVDGSLLCFPLVFAELLKSCASDYVNCLDNAKHVYKNIKKKMNIVKKVTICCDSFQKVKPIYYIDSHRVKYFKPLFLDILMIMAYR